MNETEKHLLVDVAAAVLLLIMRHPDASGELIVARKALIEALLELDKESWPSFPGNSLN